MTTTPANTDDAPLRFTFVYPLIQIVLLCLNVFVLLGAFLIFIIIRKCKTIPYQIRILSASLHLSDSLSCSFYILHFTVMFVGGVENRLLENTRQLSSPICMGMSWCSVACLAVERVFALLKPYQHSHHLTKTKVNVLLAVLWTVNVSVPLLVWIYIKTFNCNWSGSICSLEEEMTTPTNVIAGVVTVYILLTAVSFVIVRHILIKQIRSISSAVPTPRSADNTYIAAQQHGRFGRSEKAISHILLLFIILHVPYYIHKYAFETNTSGKDRVLKGITHFGLTVCIKIKSFIIQGIYFKTFSEIHLKILQLPLFRCSRCKRKAEQMRIQVYNIVTVRDQQTVV